MSAAPNRPTATMTGLFSRLTPRSAIRARMPPSPSLSTRMATESRTVPSQCQPRHPSVSEQWSDSAAVHSAAGIHALRVPCDWRAVDARALPQVGGPSNVHGIVERFGRYVLGTEGWRAEWVVIRELMAPDIKTALALMQRYPRFEFTSESRKQSMRVGDLSYSYVSPFGPAILVTHDPKRTPRWTELFISLAGAMVVRVG
jgi:hypothetical protein